MLPGLPGGPSIPRDTELKRVSEGLFPGMSVPPYIREAYGRAIVHGVQVAVEFRDDPLLEDNQRGIVLAPDIFENMTLGQSGGPNMIDPQLLRYGLAFWDKIIVVDTPNPFPGGLPWVEDGNTLREQKIVAIAQAQMPIALQGAVIGPSHLATMEELEKRQAGVWTLGHTFSGWELENGTGVGERPSIGMWLTDAVTVPHVDTPIHEILEFRERRRAELERLWSELDEAQARVNGSEDAASLQAIELARLDKALADHLAVSLESKLPLTLANIKMKISLKTWAAGVAAFEGAIMEGLPTSAALFAGIAGATAASFEAEVVKRDLSYRASAFEYVARFQKQIA